MLTLTQDFSSSSLHLQWFPLSSLQDVNTLFVVGSCGEPSQLQWLPRAQDSKEHPNLELPLLFSAGFQQKGWVLSVMGVPDSWPSYPALSAHENSRYVTRLG